MLEPYTADKIKNNIIKEIDNIKDHICYGVDSIDKLQYARGRLSALEALLQDIKNLQKEDNDGDPD
ncbi:MAG TPA: hypothetical protein DCS66_12835 [Flavobacteriaceae bacterium]|jgi:phosphatidylserine decarboxylase|nr:hypothetical protein [Flavobacteriaceae bacterium]|tara:strand:- start:2 stop:199 length:198 start_codon:yes stop_codon:yes gene_type:complete